MVAEEDRPTLEVARSELARLTGKLAVLVDQVMVEVEQLRKEDGHHG